MKKQYQSTPLANSIGALYTARKSHPRTSKEAIFFQSLLNTAFNIVYHRPITANALEDLVREALQIDAQYYQNICQALSKDIKQNYADNIELMELIAVCEIFN
jgi:hypothetical protein